MFFLSCVTYFSHTFFIKVQEHFAALKKLFDVTGGSGFMARSFGVYGDEPVGPVGPESTESWYNSTTMPGWIWKGDTSSDEVCIDTLYTHTLYSTLILRFFGFFVCLF